jgi:hypothetical protein
MPAFSLDDDRIAIRDMARAFADEKIAPYALEQDGDIMQYLVISLEREDLLSRIG